MERTEIWIIKKINKSNFYKNKKLFNIDDIDVNKVLSLRLLTKSYLKSILKNRKGLVV